MQRTTSRAEDSRVLPEVPEDFVNGNEEAHAITLCEARQGPDVHIIDATDFRVFLHQTSLHHSTTRPSLQPPCMYSGDGIECHRSRSVVRDCPTEDSRDCPTEAKFQTLPRFMTTGAMRAVRQGCQTRPLAQQREARLCAILWAQLPLRDPGTLPESLPHAHD